MQNPLDTKLGRYVDRKLAGQCMNHSRLAEYLGVSRVTVTNLINGNQRWTLHYMSLTAKFIREKSIGAMVDNAMKQVRRVI